MTLLRIGCVEYINALPLHLAFRLNQLPSTAQFVYGIPSDLNRLLQNQELDAAITSSIAHLEGDYRLGDFGITGSGKVLSVNLYSQYSLDALNGRRVGLTHHSATSVALLKILCHSMWNIKPEFEILDRKEQFSKYAAFLLIGDEALLHLNIPNFQTIDLCEAWYTHTGLPFVFATLSFQKKVQVSRIECLQHELSQALHWSHTHTDQLEKTAMQMCPLKIDLIQQYYSLMNYRLGENEKKGLELFRQLHQKINK